MVRGQVRPVNYARVGTLLGGTVIGLPVAVGDLVYRDGEVARVRTGDGSLEIIVAPWTGTVTNVPVRLGDTVVAGTPLVHLGDLRVLRVETTDLDEFLVNAVRPGQRVRVTIDALEGVELTGYVQSVALQPERNAAGDDHYPAIIALDSQPTALRAGMTARVYLDAE
ncbi:MAG: HlyD family efflux transporter periplasmic adaptor subunit [Chloroflexi bacterium]|nr:HlyD family efflux transporter periplasmic adaptor subunit [Chloroflexota bacterium]